MGCVPHGLVYLPMTLKRRLSVKHLICLQQLSGCTIASPQFAVLHPASWLNSSTDGPREGRPWENRPTVFFKKIPEFFINEEYTLPLMLTNNCSKRWVAQFYETNQRLDLARKYPWKMVPGGGNTFPLLNKRSPKKTRFLVCKIRLEIYTSGCQVLIFSYLFKKTSNFSNFWVHRVQRMKIFMLVSQ